MADSKGSMFSVLRNRRYLALWIGQVVSNLGDWADFMAVITLVAFKWEAPASYVSGLFIAMGLPWAVFAPMAGVFVDRWDRKRTMIVSDLIRAGLVLLLTQATNVWQVYAIIFVKAMFGCFFNPARQAAVKTLVREDELMPANSLGALSEQLTKIIGPALSGIMVAALGINASFYLDGLTFLVSAVFIAAVRFPSELEGKEEEKGSAFVAEFKEGLRFIRRTPVVLFVMVLLALTTFVMAPIDALISVYVREVLKESSSFMGYMVSIVGLGTTVGAVLLGSLAARKDRVLLLLTAIGAMGVGVTFLSVTRSLPLLAAGGLIIGFASAGAILPGQTLIQELTPVGLIGRVFSVFGSMATIARILGMPLAGVIANLIGVLNVYRAVGIAMIALAIAGFALAPHFRAAPVPARGESPQAEPAHVGQD